jgi:hypothetical protein
MSSAYFEVFSPDAPTSSKAVQRRYDEASALLKGKRRAVDQGPLISFLRSRPARLDSLALADPEQEG